MPRVHNPLNNKYSTHPQRGMDGLDKIHHTSMVYIVLIQGRKNGGQVSHNFTSCQDDPEVCCLAACTQFSL